MERTAVIFYTLLYLALGCSCNLFQQKIRISITNYSTASIDSIIVPYKNTKFNKKIYSRETRTIEVEMPKRIPNKSGLSLYLYQKGKKNVIGWGYCDLECIQTIKNIYVFDNGITFKDEKLLKPKEITLYVFDRTSKRVDSIIPANGSLKKKNITNKYIELNLDFENFEKDPKLKIYQQGKIYIIKVDHNWEDWNSTQEIVNVYDNGISSKK